AIIRPDPAATLSRSSFPTRRSSDLERGPRHEVGRDRVGRGLSRARRSAAYDAEAEGQQVQLQQEALGAAHEEAVHDGAGARQRGDRKSTRLNSSHSQTSYAVLCLKK